MNVKPLVSIIIPAFNAQNLIAETLDSILAKTYPTKQEPFELGFELIKARNINYGLRSAFLPWNFVRFAKTLISQEEDILNQFSSKFVLGQVWHRIYP